MKDYYQKKRQTYIIRYQIDYILDNREIPGKLLETLGLQGAENGINNN